MKKKCLLVFALIMIISFVFLSCKNEAKPPQEHEHTFEKEWSFDDTYHYHKASCEHKSEVKDKAEHTFGEWKTVDEATKTEEGKRRRECSICKYVQEENIPTTSKRAIKVIPVLDKTYDGEPIALTEENIEYKGDEATVTFEYGIKDSTGKYSSIGTKPRDAGDYELKITIGASGDIEEDEYALEHFSITKKPINLDDREFTSYFDGEWQNVFNIPSDSGLIDGDEVSIEVLNKETFEVGKDYQLYLEGSEELENTRQVRLIGKDDQNYNLEVLDGGNLNATLYCRYKETKINSNFLSNWGQTRINPITYGETNLEIWGKQDEFVYKLAKNTTDDQLTFAVKVNDTVVAEGHRVGTHYGEIPYEYKNAELDDSQETETHLKINLLPNVEGYTDEKGKWICLEDLLEMKVSFEYKVIPSVLKDTKLFSEKLTTGAYFLMKHDFNTEDSHSIKFEFDDSQVVPDITVFKIIDGNLVKVDKNEGEFYDYSLDEDDSCYIRIKITTGGTGGMTIWHMG